MEQARGPEFLGRQQVSGLRVKQYKPRGGIEEAERGGGRRAKPPKVTDAETGGAEGGRHRQAAGFRAVAGRRAHAE